MGRVVRRTSLAIVTPRKRGTNWLIGANRTAQVAVNPSVSTLDSSFSQAVVAAIGDFTIVRVRGLLSVASDQSVATEEPFGALGMMVVRESARVAGSASIPRPYDDADDQGWFVHQYFRASCRVGTDIGIAGAGGWWNEYVLDSKSMRKVQATDAIVIMLENTSDTAGLVYRLDFRMLIKVA